MTALLYWVDVALIREGKIRAREYQLLKDIEDARKARDRWRLRAQEAEHSYHYLLRNHPLTR